MSKWYKNKWLYRAIWAFNISAWTLAAVLHFTKPKGDVYTIFVEPRIPYGQQVESELENLVVNISDEKRTIVHKSELEGIKDLQSLLADAAYEEAWAYTPSNSTWSELGVANTYKVTINLEDPNRTGVAKLIASAVTTQVSDYTDVLFKSHKEVVMYHIHPLTDQEIKESADSNTESLKDAHKYLNVLHTLPSSSDLTCMTALSKEFYSENPEGSISFKIASPLGITEYNFTAKGIEMLNNDKEDSIRMEIEIKDDYKLKDQISIVHGLMEQFNQQEQIRATFVPYDLIK